MERRTGEGAFTARRGWGRVSIDTAGPAARKRMGLPSRFQVGLARVWIDVRFLSVRLNVPERRRLQTLADGGSPSPINLNQRSHLPPRPLGGG